MRSIIAASVVDLPEPVGPTTSTRPYGLLSSVDARARGTELLERAHTERHDAERERQRVALVEGVGAEAAEAGDAEREVDLQVALASSSSWRSSSSDITMRVGVVVRRAPCTFSNCTSVPSRRAVGGRPTVRWRSEAPALTVAWSKRHEDRIWVEHQSSLPLWSCAVSLLTAWRRHCADLRAS